MNNKDKNTNLKLKDEEKIELSHWLNIMTQASEKKDTKGVEEALTEMRNVYSKATPSESEKEELGKLGAIGNYLKTGYGLPAALSTTIISNTIPIGGLKTYINKLSEGLSVLPEEEVKEDKSVGQNFKDPDGVIKETGELPKKDEKATLKDFEDMIRLYLGFSGEASTKQERIKILEEAAEMKFTALQQNQIKDGFERIMALSTPKEKIEKSHEFMGAFIKENFKKEKIPLEKTQNQLIDELSELIKDDKEKGKDKKEVKESKSTEKIDKEIEDLLKDDKTKDKKDVKEKVKKDEPKKEAPKQKEKKDILSWNKIMVAGGVLLAVTALAGAAPVLAPLAAAASILLVGVVVVAAAKIMVDVFEGLGNLLDKVFGFIKDVASAITLPFRALGGYIMNKLEGQEKVVKEEPKKILNEPEKRMAQLEETFHKRINNFNERIESFGKKIEEVMERRDSIPDKSELSSKREELNKAIDRLKEAHKECIKTRDGYVDHYNQSKEKLQQIIDKKNTDKELDKPINDVDKAGKEPKKEDVKKDVKEQAAALAKPIKENAENKPEKSAVSNLEQSRKNNTQMSR